MPDLCAGRPDLAALPTPVLVTGASGFVGGRLVAALGAAGLRPRVLLRQPADGHPAWRGAAVDTHLADLASDSLREQLMPACAGVGTIFHCAGFAHALDDGGASFADRHARINRDAALCLGEAAAAAGVKRLVFVSSVKALGESSAPIDDDHPAAPCDPYGRAKFEAEQGLLELSRRSNLDVRIVRPAMVYGRGGRGNLLRMAAAIRAGRFPPLPETGNRRSLVHVDDLIEALLLVARHPAAARRGFIVSDSRPYSGRELYQALRAALGMPASRLAVPAAALRLLASFGDGLQRLSGRTLPFNRAVLARLLDSAEYLPNAIRNRLGWQARVPLHMGLREMLATEAGR